MSNVEDCLQNPETLVHGRAQGAHSIPVLGLCGLPLGLLPGRGGLHPFWRDDWALIVLLRSFFPRFIMPNSLA